MRKLWAIFDQWPHHVANTKVNLWDSSEELLELGNKANKSWYQHPYLLGNDEGLDALGQSGSALEFVKLLLEGYNSLGSFRPKVKWSDQMDAIATTIATQYHVHTSPQYKSIVDELYRNTVRRDVREPYGTIRKWIQMYHYRQLRMYESKSDDHTRLSIDQATSYWDEYVNIHSPHIENTDKRLQNRIGCFVMHRGLPTPDGYFDEEATTDAMTVCHFSSSDVARSQSRFIETSFKWLHDLAQHLHDQ